jgi:hypothetical protein
MHTSRASDSKLESREWVKIIVNPPTVQPPDLPFLDLNMRTCGEVSGNIHNYNYAEN